MPRALEFLATALLLALALPLLAAIGLLIFMFLGTPILFVQVRPGINGKPFSLIKFRTMTPNLAPDGEASPDEVRLTKLGRYLRAASLDELPELWNVLRGEMSLVGPRPLLMEYLPLYSPEQARRHVVRPGITGWAQVNGRNELSWEQKFALDVWYVDHRSMKLDFIILWRTVVAVLLRHGINNDGHATMPPFEGRLGAKK